ncbi:tail assembly chaperone [Enterococcus hulanensis]|uniref:tail assembly chaperone n=1 Tax=Enterococcus hulanensis TaxID=2559929 RepID=UPI001A8DA6DF|nr:tail assembly chaperone [Enterococcus hulanensis]MBO0456284.1 tail assembly chaperone [Enterococcus hulanensis]
MKLKIKNKNYSFKFGVKFVREIDKSMPVKRDDMEFGLGLSAKILPELQSGNINTLSKVLYIASRTETPSLTQDEIDDYVDDVEDIEGLFDEVMKDLGESNAGKLAVANLEKELKKQQNKAQS